MHFHWRKCGFDEWRTILVRMSEGCSWRCCCWVLRDGPMFLHKDDQPTISYKLQSCVWKPGPETARNAAWYTESNILTQGKLHACMKCHLKQLIVKKINFLNVFALKKTKQKNNSILLETQLHPELLQVYRWYSLYAVHLIKWFMININKIRQQGNALITTAHDLTSTEERIRHICIKS